MDFTLELFSPSSLLNLVMDWLLVNFWLVISLFVLIYYIKSSQTNETQVIVPEGVSEEEANVQYVDWRPSSSDVVYVYDNDIRMKRIGSNGKLGDEIRLTSSGVPGKKCKFSDIG